MTLPTKEIIHILKSHNINPTNYLADTQTEEIDLPDIGHIGDNETVYATSIESIFGFVPDDDFEGFPIDLDDPRIQEWWAQVQEIMYGRNKNIPTGIFQISRQEAPGPHCAWYCPIHFFGYDWGIYIRESCVLDYALGVASYVNWSRVSIPRANIPKHLLRCGFYAFFLHEQFHHKVESLGFRLLVATRQDRYRPYKRNVYRKTFLTSACIEEGLANADSYRRLAESRYKKRLDPAILFGFREFLDESIRAQPAGYNLGMTYSADPEYHNRLHELQSQVLDGKASPVTPPRNWSISPKVITSLAPISAEIYMVLPRGARPIFNPTTVDPGVSASTEAVIKALTRHYGYTCSRGAKGSHVKLEKAGAPTIVLPGNRKTLTPGAMKHALDAVGGHPISRLPDLLKGRLPVSA
ncbi:type II toxin-antitoxin system HicA family toxin [Rhodovibrio sodomensis]|uniref:type II toxin-antitoxin system HicA family toxin n=1 Tax=Rhodovibrio sodomensis TaxID=1088 RepID=UPI0019059CF6|nr:type II toxin-antitoxin system HicA family toxin [Rhodovibrio sodomensis]